MRTSFQYYLLICLVTFLLSGRTAHGQRISFGTWAGSNIEVIPVSVNTLNFGIIIIGGAAKTISLGGEATAYKITAPEGYDLTVTIDSPTTLVGPNSKTIPFGLAFAYSNQGSTEVITARNMAVEVTTGFNAISFPIKRNTMGLPAPPPTPSDGSSEPRITASAYLFFYGTAGPAAVGADAGLYTGEININVEYTSY